MFVRNQSSGAQTQSHPPLCAPYPITGFSHCDRSPAVPALGMGLWLFCSWLIWGIMEVKEKVPCSLTPKVSVPPLLPGLGTQDEYVHVVRQLVR